VIADIDVWRAAHLLVKQNGDDAVIVAARHADTLLERGDVEGQIVWKRITGAVAELLEARAAQTMR
jgi:hypothetical protein